MQCAPDEEQTDWLESNVTSAVLVVPMEAGRLVLVSMVPLPTDSWEELQLRLFVRSLSVERILRSIFFFCDKRPISVHKMVSQLLNHVFVLLVLHVRLRKIQSGSMLTTC